MWTKPVDKPSSMVEILHEFYQNNDKKLEIRRAILKKLFEDKISKELGGNIRYHGGGSFQRCINKLQYEGFISVQKTTKKTIILMNIKKIEYQLQVQSLKTSFDQTDRKRIVEENVEDSILGEIIEEFYGSELDKTIQSKYKSKPGESYYIIKELMAKSMANMMSRAFEFNVNYDPGGHFHVDREFVMAMASPIFEKAQKDQEAAFKVTIEYKGVSKSEKDALAIYGPAISDLEIDCFVRWVKAVFDYVVKEEEKNNLNEAKQYLLGEPVSTYYNIFVENCNEYLNLSWSFTTQTENKRVR
jgi:hypothetical protein